MPATTNKIRKLGYGLPVKRKVPSALLKRMAADRRELRQIRTGGTQL